MTFRYKGGVISATAPTITPPVNGEGGTASGVWTLEQQFQNAGNWPKPVIQKQLWMWAAGDQGQLGLGNITSYSSPKQVGSLTTWSKISLGYFNSIAIQSDGTIWSWGQNSYGQLGLGNTTNYSSPKQIGSLTNWLQISAGTYSTMSIKTNGTIWGWGGNFYGGLGLGDTTSRSSPVQVGALTTWVVLSNMSNSNSSSALKTP